MSILERSILNEIEKFNKINQYLKEQDALGGIGAPPAPPAPVPAGVAPPPAGAAPGTTPDAAADTPGLEATPVDDLDTTPVNTETDPDVEKIGSEGDKGDEEDEGSEELDITDLVSAQKEISEKQTQLFDELTNQLKTLESKLSNMDQLMSRIDSLDAKLEKYRPKTAQEKLQLRSLDSGPYNQNLSQYFQDKMPDLEKAGKNEYVLTTDDVEDFSMSDVKDSFDLEKPKNFGL
jgi:hypothetical protein